MEYPSTSSVTIPITFEPASREVLRDMFKKLPPPARYFRVHGEDLLTYLRARIEHADALGLELARMPLVLAGSRQDADRKRRGETAFDVRCE